MKYVIEIDPTIPFDANSFKIKEYKHWIKTCQDYDSINFAGSKEDLNRLKVRVLGYARSRNHILETTLKNTNTYGTIINIRYTGDL